MAQTNYTPISLYYSATAASVPTAGNLVAGELALNTADGKLFYKDSAGVVQVLATKGGVGSSTTTQVLYNSSGLVVGSAGLTFDGTNLATTGTTTATRFIPSGSTVATNGMFLPAANTLGFSTASTEAMRIDSSGNVGIGTSSPSAKLHVSAPDGTAPLTLNTAGGSDSTRALNFNVAGDNYGKILVPSGSGGAMAFWTGGANAAAERMRIASNGIVTMSAYGAGAATFSAAGVISSVSDETWKIKDGVPTNPDAMLQKLEAGYWFYNEEKSAIFGQDRQLGFYAQNVHEAIGEEAAPTPEEGKPWGYYDRSVLAITVMSLKNALSTIEDLKQRIATLEAK